MFVIKHKSQKGGFWKDGKLVREIRTENESLADEYRKAGHTVIAEEEEKPEEKANKKK